ncbi:MAG: hypothetical protein KU37_07410 [Sulfuricurvum sp. PC08-66]|nr:MAG: hypothetical protein KU37_07410 [Sulfuricurvum sp. PC08-66]
MRTLLLFVLSLGSAMALTLDSPIPAVTIPVEKGGYVAGGAFATADFVGQTSILMFVDPDNGDEGKNMNEAIKTARVAGRIRREDYKSFVLIDMASTWKPNFAIASALESKQKEFPYTRFIKDSESITSKAWGIEEGGYTCIILDAQGVVRFAKRAPFSDADTREAVELLVRLTHPIE